MKIWYRLAKDFAPDTLPHDFLVEWVAEEFKTMPDDYYDGSLEETEFQAMLAVNEAKLQAHQKQIRISRGEES